MVRNEVVHRRAGLELALACRVDQRVLRLFDTWKELSTVWLEGC